MAGQFLVVFLCIPILTMFGPQELHKIKSAKRRSVSNDRGHTVSHLIQMMSIMEEEGEDTVPANLLVSDRQLGHLVKNLMVAERNLNILDTIPVSGVTRPGQAWKLSRQTTARHSSSSLSSSSLSAKSNAIGSCG